MNGWVKKTRNKASRAKKDIGAGEEGNEGMTYPGEGLAGKSVTSNV